MRQASRWGSRIPQTPPLTFSPLSGVAGHLSCTAFHSSQVEKKNHMPNTPLLRVPPPTLPSSRTSQAPPHHHSPLPDRSLTFLDNLPSIQIRVLDFGWKSATLTHSVSHPSESATSTCLARCAGGRHAEALLCGVPLPARGPAGAAGAQRPGGPAERSGDGALAILRARLQQGGGHGVPCGADRHRHAEQQAAGVCVWGRAQTQSGKTWEEGATRFWGKNTRFQSLKRRETVRVETTTPTGMLQSATKLEVYCDVCVTLICLKTHTDIPSRSALLHRHAQHRLRRQGCTSSAVVVEAGVVA